MNYTDMGVATGGYSYPGVGAADPNAMGQWGMGNAMMPQVAPPAISAPAIAAPTGVMGGVGATVGAPATDISAVTANILNGDPQAGLGKTAIAGADGGSGFGWNMGTAQTLVGGLQAFGNLYNSYQQTKMAREQLSFQKEAYQTNLENTTQNYNTTLEDRIKSRYKFEGKSSDEANSYLDEHKL
jgi:hypothetical protein